MVLETFPLFCLLNESPPFDAEERAMIDDNQMAVALTGRDPALVLHRRRDPASLLRRLGGRNFRFAAADLRVVGPAMEQTHATALAEQRDLG